jgi:hypothetical protein
MYELRRRDGPPLRKGRSTQSQALWAVRVCVPNGRMAGQSWFEGKRLGASIGVPGHEAGSRKVRHRTLERQRVSELVAARCRLSQPKGAEGRRQEQGSTSRRLFTGEALAAKNRDTSDSARGANHLPFLWSRWRTMVPHSAASAAWGAHRMKDADEGGQPEPPCLIEARSVSVRPSGLRIMRAEV